MTTWTAPEAHRVPEPQTGDERAMLRGWLDYHRQTLLLKCAGLTAEQLRLASVEPSRLTLLGLVRHMAEVERWWFRTNAAQDKSAGDLYCTEASPDGDFDDVAGADAEADFATFRAEIRACDDAVAALPLEHEFPGRRGPISLRWVYTHMIEEYARHNGHADLLRERVDGVTGD
ncbi:DinB family protein [Actinoplanes oblitus]|uniref:DinB family protein n=1 Tax=Actinoplanes oblitus TaxID=3040509 RepID=A0ABY8WDL6_9ACTN|nr:DinB family protein [Actinoplanes oblitus]WIM95477.1 DinB family protein [Actinoplanes oblitus]